MIWQAPQDAVAALVLAHGAGRGDAPSADAGARGRIRAARHRDAALRFSVHRRRARAASTRPRSRPPRSPRSSRRPPRAAHCRSGSADTRSAAECRLMRWPRGSWRPPGLIFCSFPLHMPGKPATTRAAHLARSIRPMLFLSGTRDPLAERALLEGVVAALPSAKLHWLDTADHGYKVLKRSRASAEDVFDEIGRVAREFIDSRRRGAEQPPAARRSVRASRATCRVAAAGTRRRARADPPSSSSTERAPAFSRTCSMRAAFGITTTPGFRNRPREGDLCGRRAARPATAVSARSPSNRRTALELLPSGEYAMKVIACSRHHGATSHSMLRCSSP